jgi:CRP-like cAMP-binding protein
VDWLVEAAELAHLLRPLSARAGDVLMRQGEPGTEFVLIVEGLASVRRDRGDGNGSQEVATAGPGAVLGELALLTNHPRTATVVAVEPITGFAGGVDGFEALLERDPIRHEFALVAARRLAVHARAVPIELRDGSRLLLRPLLPSDRAAVEEGMSRLSPESLRRRFFSGGRPSSRVLDYLIDIDYVGHFAWVTVEPAGRPGVAVARYIRRVTEPEVAEMAFTVVDEYQGRGLGTLLLGALGLAGAVAGVERFAAEVLADNAPMRAVLDKAGAQWALSEPGVVATEVAVAPLAQLLDTALAEQLGASILDIATAAHLALA